MIVIEKYSDSNKTVKRDGGEVVAEYFNSLNQKEQVFFFELLSEVANGFVSEVNYSTETGKRALFVE